MQHGPMNHANHDERPPREAAPRRPAAPAADGGRGQGLFSDLSVPQVAAGALAAVTSMLLSNQIGIAGSVIGVAVGSVVSTVASSLYKRAIARGADRIKEKIVVPGEEPQVGGGAGAAGMAAGQVPGAAGDAGDESGTVTPDGTRIAPEGLRERARARHDRTVQKRVTMGVLAVAVVAAIVGVGLTAVNMAMGFAGTPLIASPINCGALCMILSLIIVPVVSLFTPSEEFPLEPPSRLSAADRAFEEQIAREEAAGEPVPGSAADGAREGISPTVQEAIDTVRSS